MMTSCISPDTSWLSQVNQLNSTNQTNKSGDTNTANGTTVAPPRGGDLLNAVTQALSQIGVGGSADSSTSTSSSSSATQDPAQALATFFQNLMQALHAQNGGAAGTQNGADSDGDKDGGGASSVAGSGKHHHHHLQADLQSLINELSSSSGGSSSSNNAAPDSSSSDSAISSLQQSYQNLVSALGDSGSTASLGDFLQAFANNTQNASSVGGILKTQA